jgi:uncharacterized membrane protein YhaH (DUF805 family)
MIERPDYGADETRQQVVYLLLRFKGRIGAIHYRRGLLICVLLLVVSACLYQTHIPEAAAPFLALMAWIFLAVTIKRLHDFDRSGGWSLLLIPVLFLVGLNWAAGHVLLLGLDLLQLEARHGRTQPIRS